MCHQLAQRGVLRIPQLTYIAEQVALYVLRPEPIRRFNMQRSQSAALMLLVGGSCSCHLLRILVTMMPTTMIMYSI